MITSALLNRNSLRRIGGPEILKLLVTVPLLLMLVNADNVLPPSQEEELLELRLSRTLGFGLGSLIQGTFTIRVSGPDDLVLVRFLIDDVVIGEDREAPFRLRFVTGNHDDGVHVLSATGVAADGEELRSNRLTRQFVSGQSITVFAVVFVALVLAVRLGRMFLSRGYSRRGREERGYGWLGGAVCPRCGRPFGRHWWGLNLLGRRLDRCPHCGKWHGARRATADELAAAEAKVHSTKGTEGARADWATTEAKRLEERLEESKYDDR